MLFCPDITHAKPSKGFQAPPYHVESFPGYGVDGWHCVVGSNNFNCLSFDKPFSGAKFTTYKNAVALAARWNGEDGMSAHSTFWTIAAESEEYGTVYLHNYAASERYSVVDNVMLGACREQFVGTLDDRLAFLKWRIVHMRATEICGGTNETNL